MAHRCRIQVHRYGHALQRDPVSHKRARGSQDYRRWFARSFPQHWQRRTLSINPPCQARNSSKILTSAARSAPGICDTRPSFTGWPPTMIFRRTAFGSPSKRLAIVMTPRRYSARVIETRARGHAVLTRTTSSMPSNVSAIRAASDRPTTNHRRG